MAEEDYKPLEYFRDTDSDKSSRPIRDFPADRKRYDLSVFPKNISFNKIKVDEESIISTIIIKNTGYDVILINEIVVSGDFELTSPNPTLLKPNYAASIGVRFKPTKAGTHTGAVYINTGDASGDENVYLMGEAEPLEDNSEQLCTTFILAQNNGSGDANYIQATTKEVIPAGSGKVLIGFNITDTNTSEDVFVEFNGLRELKVIGSDGNPPAIGSLVEGMTVIGFRFGSEFRLLVDNQIAAILAYLERFSLEEYNQLLQNALNDLREIEDDVDTIYNDIKNIQISVINAIEQANSAAQEAKDYAESAYNSANEAALYDPTFRFKNVVDLLSSTRALGGVGTIWQGGEFLYEEAATSGPSTVETVGGVPLYLRRNADLVVYSEQAGVDATETDAAKINVMLSKALAAGARTVKMSKGEWAPNGQIVWPVGLKEIDWQGSRVTSTISASAIPILDYVGTYTVLPPLSAYASADRDYLNFGLPHGLQVGDVIALRNTNPESLNAWRAYYYDGQTTRIREVVSATQVRTTDPIDPRGALRVFPGGTTEVVKFHRESSGICLRNVDMQSDTAWALARLRFCTDIEVENFRGECYKHGGLLLSKGAYGRIEGTTIDCLGPASGTNYPLSFDSWSHTIIDGFKGSSSRHAVAFGSGDSISSGPPRGNTLISPILASTDSWALDFGHGNILDHRVIGGNIQGVNIGGGNNTVDVDMITTPRVLNGNVAIMGTNLHDCNHVVRAKKVIVGGNGRLEDGTTPSPHGIISFGGTGDTLSGVTVDGGIIDIEIGELNARLWGTSAAPLARYRNRGFEGHWGVRQRIDRIISPSQAPWFNADVVSGSSPILIDIERQPSRWDPSSTPVHGWSGANRGFSIPAISEGGQLMAPVLKGSIDHGGGAIGVGVQIVIAVAGFANLKISDTVDWGVSGNPGNLTVTSFVSSPTTVALIVSNQGAAAITLPELTWYAYVKKRA